MYFGIDNMLQTASYRLYNPKEGLVNVNPLLDDKDQEMSRFSYYNASNLIFEKVLSHQLSLNEKDNMICYMLLLGNPYQPSIHGVACFKKLWNLVLCVNQINYTIPTPVQFSQTTGVKIRIGNIFSCEMNISMSTLNYCDGVIDCPGVVNDESNCTCKMNGLLINDNKYCSQKCHLHNCSCSHMYRQKLSGGCGIYINNHINRQIETIGEMNKSYLKVAERITLKGNDPYGGINNSCPEQNMENCYSGLDECYSLNEVCQYKVDGHSNTLSICTNGKHLEGCKDFKCLQSSKCYNSYCIPYTYICNGKWDCWDGSDEAYCLSRLCSGMFKCRHSSVCFPLDLVCDDNVDCAYSDDEIFCHSCLPMCYCLGMAILCNGVQDIEINSMNMFASITIFGGFLSRHINFKMAINILISKSHVTELWKVIHTGNYTVLATIEMTLVKMRKIKKCPRKMLLPNLKCLNVSNNIISGISSYAFTSLNKLNHLDLSNNKLHWLTPKISSGLSSLKFIKLTGNVLLRIQYGTFHSILVKVIIIDRIAICCKLSDSKVVCSAKLPSQKCRRLTLLKYSSFFLSFFIILSNGTVSYFLKHNYKRKTKYKLWFLYIALTRTLHFSGFLLGIYLLVIAFFHSYRGLNDVGEYLDMEDKAFCSFLLYLSTFSISLSCLITLLLSLSRFLIIGYQIQDFLTVRAFYAIIVILIILNILPFLLFYQGNGNFQSALCFILEIKGSSIYLTLLSLGLYFLFTLILFSSIILYFLLFVKVKKLTKEVMFEMQINIKEHKYFSMMNRTKVTVAIICLYYTALCIVSLHSTFHKGANDRYLQHYTVFAVLPIYPLLNPFLYNFQELKTIWSKIRFKGIV